MVGVDPVSRYNPEVMAIAGRDEVVEMGMLYMVKGISKQRAISKVMHVQYKSGTFPMERSSYPLNAPSLLF